MSYCLNPACCTPQNLPSEQFCQTCGGTLLLRKRYRALQPLGQGGFGKTFLACDQDLPSQPRCVIKQLYLPHAHAQFEAKALQLFKQEAFQLYNLGKHEQIPRLLAYFQEENQFYLVQELIIGKTLDQEFWRDAAGLEDKVRQFLGDLLPVLQYLHQKKVIHRDIKPENIIRRQKDNRLILIDFGIARLLTDTALMGGATIVGTPQYMAPEQTRGKVLPASDLYSLGVTCLRLMTQTSPLEMFDVEEEKWLWEEYLKPPTHLTPQLRAVVTGLVEPSLRHRFRSAMEVMQALDLEATGLANNAEEAKTTQLLSSSTPSRATASQPGLQNLSAGLIAIRKKNPVSKNIIKIDYKPLRNFLLRKKWREADEETWSILCQLTAQPDGSHLSQTQIKNLPCQHLSKLDLLWCKYSRGRFSFRVQKQIYEQVGREYDLFCQSVGWPTHRPPDLTAHLDFTRRAPLGHLPSRRWVGGYSWWQHAKVLAEKLEQCGIG